MAVEDSRVGGEQDEFGHHWTGGLAQRRQKFPLGRFRQRRPESRWSLDSGLRSGETNGYGSGLGALGDRAPPSEHGPNPGVLELLSLSVQSLSDGHSSPSVGE